ncbi:glutamyl-tRNA reductase-binding protein, chloroplastic [Canna indica]|uniref:Glutamyl-tRNA reductase-binding protein, chloroplastic n=1 Tax=Canna indica TaxID=4628 RepID=A0AAQ3KBV5_9LILI|nr:glutamyl-tRNA reductase-binding protein, chloroplastic [Canna indica]
MPPLPQTLLSPTISPPLPTLYLSKTPVFASPHQIPFIRLSSRRSRSFHLQPRFSLLSVSTEAPLTAAENLGAKPSPAEVSRTIVELSSTGTLSSLSPDGWPLGIGARFVVDAEGAPAVCLKHPESLFAADCQSSFHVQYQQTGSRTPQCTLLGKLSKPDDSFPLKRLCTKWEKKYGEEVEENLLYLFSVEKVLQIEDLKEEGIWVTPSDYLNAEPDPLRNFAEKIVDEMNSKHVEDVRRFCSVYVEPGFQAADAKLIWVDRLGFDLFIYSENAVFAVRIPFPREVTDEKAVKSSFNSMSHLAWEIERGYLTLDFDKKPGGIINARPDEAWIYMCGQAL